MIQKIFQMNMRKTNMEIKAPKNEHKLLGNTRDFLRYRMVTGDMKFICSELDICRATRSTSCVRSMALVGPSGVGKSHCIKKYKNSNPDYVDDNQKVIPVLIASLAQKSTTKELMIKLLSSLTGCGNITGTESHIRARLISRLKASRTEIVFIDEAQHLVRETSDIAAQHAADAIKSLMDEVRLPIVLVGIESLKSLIYGKAKFEAEKQMIRRYRKLHVLIPYESKSEQWEKIMTNYQRKLNVDADADLISDNMLERMHVATDGLFGNIKPLFFEALRLAGADNKITQDILAKAYEVFQPKNPLAINPFLATKSELEVTITLKLEMLKEKGAA
jgi:type II secretory pathway predicted ATPase ExeA